MPDIWTVFLIGVALSMDAFSLSLAIGTLNINNKKQLFFVSVVGLLHFIMPLIGLFLGQNIVLILHISAKLLIAAILLLISFEMLKCVISDNEKCFNVNLHGLVALAFSVSFDSFSVGLGITYISNSWLVASLIFSVLSALFTYLGLCIGRYSKKAFGKLSNGIGAIILLIVAVMCLCK